MGPPTARAAAAGVAVALGAAEGAGVILVTAGVAVVLAAAGLAVGDAFALAAGAFFISFLLCFFAAGVALAAGSSPEAFVSGATGGAAFGAFFSSFGAAGVWVAAGSFTAGSFTAGSFTTGSFTAGASAFGALGALGFTSAGRFFSDAGFLLLGDSSGVGCWAITAPASASEQTISKLVNFFMLIWVGRRRARSIQRGPLSCPQCFA